MKYIEFDIKIITQTEKAALVEFIEEEEEFWVPWSVIEDNDEDFKNEYEGAMCICEWWVEKERLA